MKKFFLLITAFSLWSCDIAYDGEVRYHARVQLVDRVGNPISGLEGRLITTRDEEDSDVISTDVSDANGYLDMAFPKRSNGHYSVFVQQTDLYAASEIYGVSEADFVNYAFPATQLPVYRHDELTFLTVYPQSVTGAILESIELTAPIPQNEINFSPEDPENPYYGFTSPVFTNADTTLHYVTSENGVQSDHTVIIPIADIPVEYTLNY